VVQDQDKTKTRIGKWIHDELTHYIHFGNFEQKKVNLMIMFCLTFVLLE